MSYLHLLAICSNMHQTKKLFDLCLFLIINPFFPYFCTHVNTYIFFRLTLTQMHKWWFFKQFEILFHTQNIYIIILKCMPYMIWVKKKSSAVFIKKKMPLNTQCTHINIFNVLCSVQFHYPIKYISSNAV